MAMRRGALIGPPHIYYLTAATSWERPCFRARADREALLDLVEDLRSAWDLRLYAFAIEPDRYHLVLRHRDDQFAASGPRDTTLSGLMKTFAQRSSRAWHRRHGGRGPLWAERYRCCLLADDTALLIAVAWIDLVVAPQLPPAAASRDRLRSGGGRPQLAPLPIRATADGEIYPADETPLDLPPPPPTEADRLFRHFAADLDAAQLATYGAALRQGWSLGRPESLTESLARLGRDGGRGRSRRLRELEDEHGLCGVWG